MYIMICIYYNIYICIVAAGDSGLQGKNGCSNATDISFNPVGFFPS